jgi:hypothetical protein
MIISGYYPDGFTLAANGYLTITPTGSIAGGLTALAQATVVNSGSISGAEYGAGVSLTNDDTMTNLGSIIAGKSGSTSVASAAGVSISDGSLTNQGTIIGAAGTVSVVVRGEYIYHYYSPGGAGVEITNGDVHNSGKITGGKGGYISSYFHAYGGSGVDMSNGNLYNSGTISYGVDVTTGNIYNTREIDGDLKSDGVIISGGTLNNEGRITASGNGIEAVKISEGSLENSGKILGQVGADGVVVSEGTVSITNQAGARISGSFGVSAASGSDVTVTNFGTIQGAFASFDDAGTLIEEGTGVLVGKAFGGNMELGAAAGTGTISGLGDTINFANITVDAGADWYFSGTNTLNGCVLTNDGTADLSASMGLWNGGELINGPRGRLYLDGNVGISQVPGAAPGAQVINGGFLAKLSGAGTSIIWFPATDAGQIVIDSGVLALAGATNSISGPISGAGEFQLSSGATTLETGASISTASWEIIHAGASLVVATSLAYTGDFTSNGARTITLNAGKSLTLGGPASFARDTVGGAGRLWTRGASTVSSVILGGTAEWVNAATIDATGNFTVGDSTGDEALFYNEASGVFDIVGDTDVDVGTNVASLFTNAGLLEKTGGTGMSAIAVRVLNRGVIEAASGVLDLVGAVSGAGALDIGAGATLEIGSSVGVTSYASFTGAGGVLELADASAFRASVSGFGAGETIDLSADGFGAGTTIAYSGTSSSGVLTLTDGSARARIALLGQYAATDFVASSDGHGGADITFVASPAVAPALAAPGH